MTPELVIFDCDGVLVDTEQVAMQVMSDSFARYGLTIAPKDCEALFVGGTMQSAGEEAARLGADLPDGWLDQTYAELFTALSKGVAIYPGIFELLDLLDARGIQTCVASNGPPRKMEISLGPSGLYERFKGRLYSGHTHGPPKPDPAMLLHAMADFDVLPDRCVMIDDSPTGLNAALAAGVRPIAFDSLGQPERLRIGDISIVRHHDDIPPLLQLTA